MSTLHMNVTDGMLRERIGVWLYRVVKGGGGAFPSAPVRSGERLLWLLWPRYPHGDLRHRAKRELSMYKRLADLVRGESSCSATVVRKSET